MRSLDQNICCLIGLILGQLYINGMCIQRHRVYNKVKDKVEEDQGKNNNTSKLPAQTLNSCVCVCVCGCVCGCVCVCVRGVDWLAGIYMEVCDQIILIG